MLDLLEIVLASGRCTLTGAAASAGLTPTTALRHLRALEARGYVRRDDGGRYSAGPTIVRIAAALHDAGPLADLVAAAQPYLDELVGRTGESAYLAIGDGTTATYIATAESSHGIRHVAWVGQHVPLEGTAVGAALAMPGTPAIRTGAVEPDITAVSQALEPALLARGRSVTAGSDLGVAISVIGPSFRLGPDEQPAVVDALADAVDRLTADVGGLGPPDRSPARGRTR